jgi:recombination protein RecT
MKNANAPSLKESGGDVALLLQQSLPALKRALPSKISAERFARVALTTIRMNPQLLTCSQHSLLGSLMESAQLGLEVDTRGLAYLVPYKGRCTLIIGYKGYMELAYRSGRIKNIYAEIVYEHDEFDLTLGTEKGIRHRLDMTKPRGRIVAAYAVAQFVSGGSHFEYIQEWEWKKRMGVSAAGTRGPWGDWEEEMIKKTAIKKLCKFLPLSPEVQRAVSVDEAAEAQTQDLSYRAAEAMEISVDEVVFPSKTQELKEKLGVEQEEGEPQKGEISEETRRAREEAWGEGDGRTD